MASSVVAVFDEFEDAREAVNELLDSGFDDTEVKLSSKEAAPIERIAVIKSGAKAWLEDLLGTDDDELIAPYADAVRHGNYVVSARLPNEDRTDIASAVMSQHHPIDLDEHTSSVRVFLGVK